MGTPLRFPNCPEQCLKNMCCSRRESPSKTSPSRLYFSYIPPNSSQQFRKNNLIYLLSSLVSCSQNRLHSLSYFKLRLEAGSKRNDTFKLNSTQYFTRRRQKLIDQDAKPTPPSSEWILQDVFGLLHVLLHVLSFRREPVWSRAQQQKGLQSVLTSPFHGMCSVQLWHNFRHGSAATAAKQGKKRSLDMMLTVKKFSFSPLCGRISIFKEMLSAQSLVHVS